MEYLVTMTTRVPDGTTEREVAEVRAREAAHSRELAARGRLLRLWRPPLEPGEWRSIGLFDDAGPDALERTLAAMPLRVWRTDVPTELARHPADPGPGGVPVAADSEEYLVTFAVDVPSGTRPESPAESKRVRDMAAEGYLIRLWTLSGGGRAIGLWQAPGAGRLREILRSLPMAGWRPVDTVPLTRHPSDPAQVT
ncbi:muconolactone Delta-isomerase family protein [Streptomyces sp. NPDC051105]|uniref:muconolactone Delta-isomerase family protein n=1 Tax=Streptomyces sp. NPDC051105 TaxID=3154843 RepID=UPI003430993E